MRMASIRHAPLADPEGLGDRGREGRLAVSKGSVLAPRSNETDENILPSDTEAIVQRLSTTRL